ncbi:MAG: hypothetical protein WDW38_007636 [Sanguina aurantia]
MTPPHRRPWEREESIHGSHQPCGAVAPNLCARQLLQQGFPRRWADIDALLLVKAAPVGPATESLRAGFEGVATPCGPSPPTPPAQQGADTVCAAGSGPLRRRDPGGPAAASSEPQEPRPPWPTQAAQRVVVRA